MKNRQNTIDGVVEFVLIHGGPDELGRGHDMKKSLMIDVLEEALEIAQRFGLSEAVRPYHFRYTRGVWKNEEYVDEVLVEKIDSLLESKYNTNLIDFIMNTSLDELSSDLIEQVGEKQLTVKLNGVIKNFDQSPFEMITRYIQLKGLEKRFFGIRPYHLKNASVDTYDNEQIVDELVAKKVDQLLETKYGGNLVKLITGTSANELSGELTDYLDGQEVKVSMETLVHHKFTGSPFKMITRYIQLKGLEERFLGIRKYHFAQSGESGEGTADELLVKKIDQLLEQERYGGNLVKLITNTGIGELSSELTDYLDGQEVKVSMHRIAAKFNYSPFEMITRYIQLKGLEERFLGIRPYHIDKASGGTYRDGKIVDELVAKKVDQLLETKYGGNLVKLITGTSVDELSSELIDYLDGQEVKVSMETLVHHRFTGRPFEMVTRYIQLKGLEKRFWGIRPYHFAKSGRYDERTVDEVLVKKINQLLEGEYFGDITKLTAETGAKELFAPLIDYLDGQEVKVSMGVVAVRHSHSPLGMINHYKQLMNPA
jgi:predicted thioesterase